MSETGNNNINSETVDDMVNDDVNVNVNGSEYGKTKPKFIKVEELTPGSVGFNCIVRQVGDIKTIMHRKNLDQSIIKISETVIGDETGCILLSLRNEQIDIISKGNAIILRNAKIDMIKNGYMRVAIDRWGLIEKISDNAFIGIDEINLDNNLSGIQYELVRQRDSYRNNNNNRRNYNNNNRGNYNNNRGRGRYAGYRGNRGRGRGRGGNRGRGGRGRGRGRGIGRGRGRGRGNGYQNRRSDDSF